MKKFVSLRGADFFDVPEFTNEPRKTRKTRKTRKGLSGNRSFCINGGITVFETRFPRDSQNQESTAVPRTRWRSDIRNFSPSASVFASCGPSCSPKVSNTVTAAVASFVHSIYSIYSYSIHSLWLCYSVFGPYLVFIPC